MQSCKTSQEGPPYPQGEAKVWDKEKVDEVQHGKFIHTLYWSTLPQGQSWPSSCSVADEASSQIEKREDTAHLFLSWCVTAVSAEV